MPNVILSERTYRQLVRFAAGPMTRLAAPLPGGFWAIPVDDVVLHAIREQRLPGEGDDAVIWRLIVAAFPLRLLPELPPGVGFVGA